MNKKDRSAEKKEAALQAIKLIQPDDAVGVGTGSTVAYFIEALADLKHRIKGAVASSLQSEALLKQHGIPLLDLNHEGPLPIYVDGADEVNALGYCIKGGGAALTREKILAACSKQFVCMVDSSKVCNVFGHYPLPIEVIPMARSYVARQLFGLGGEPLYREGVTTDNGNIILDVRGLCFHEPLALEKRLNNITGIVCHGLFAHRAADLVFVGNGTLEKK
jgi:ribose 5-phosphate isomerase A